MNNKPNIQITPKQREYLSNSKCRWNIKTGAVRSGKTFIDYFVIPYRVRTAGDGMILFIGNTRQSLERNIFAPMREMWSDEYVGRINGDGFIRLFGRDCFAMGGALENSADKIQGSSVAYCYGDEITTWSSELFYMLQSRLDKPYSKFDGTCNPASPNHWFKAFLDSGADVYVQHYTIDDNPFLERDYVENLKKSYYGSVYYDRYILGRWTNAEGLVYPYFADNYMDYLTEELPRSDRIICGLDFGGNRSRSACVCIGIKYPPAVSTDDTKSICAILSERADMRSPAHLTSFVKGFALRVKDLTGFLPEAIFCDNAESMLLRGLKSDFASDDILCQVQIRPALKRPVKDRIYLTNALIAKKNFSYAKSAGSLADALISAQWGKDDTRLDDFTSDIDTLDAFEYALERS